MRRSTEALVGAGAVALQSPFLAYLSRQPAWGTALLSAGFLVPAAALNWHASLPTLKARSGRHLALALGTLGMLTGWFADAGFHPLVGAGLCLCGCADSEAGLGVLTSFHWMQVLMLAGCASGVVASRGIAAALTPSSARSFLASSVLMLLGMALLGWAEGRIGVPNPSLGLVLAYLAMAAGMAAGSALAAGLGRVPSLLQSIQAEQLSRRPGALTP